MDKEEIIKGLECCQTRYNRKCYECPYMKYKSRAITISDCSSELRKDLLKLIKKESL
jgi:hypothetical protein